MPDDSSATRRLIDRADQGDAAALGELISRHSDAMQGVVRRRLGKQLAGRVDAADVIQEVQQTAVERFSEFCRRRPMPFRLWILKTTHERIVDAERVHLHAQRRSVTRELPLSDASSLCLAQTLQGSPARPDQQLMKQEVAQKIRRCLATLSEADREILMLRCFEGLPNREVATLLELKAETTRKRFTRALLRLRQAFESAGLADTDAVS